MSIKSVIVVGGSVAGLLQGLQLKRNGINVTVLERDPSKDRHNHESGVSIGPSVVRLLDKFDATGRPAAIPSEFLSLAWKKHLRIFNMVWKHNMSNWGCLYLILRANFDGLASKAVPQPPGPKPGDGAVEYKPGHDVTGVRYDPEKSQVYVKFIDFSTGKTGELGADMVIAADGVHSTIRQLIQAPTLKVNSGYIAFRGTVPESLLSQGTIEYFSNRLNITMAGGMYMISYHIPTEQGDVEPGNRLVNWVWYFPVAEGSAEMKAIFTDVNGKYHTHTVTQGLLNADMWEHQKARFADRMTAPIIEVISKTTRPFVTKVTESQCQGSPSYFDGRLVLVGDAYTGFRSHLGMASEQAARHCLQMEQVLQGKMTAKQRDAEVVLYARRFILLNRVIGLTGMTWLWSLFRTVVAYGWLMAAHRLGLA